MPYSAVFETRVRGKLARLERINPRITAFHVTLESSHHHHRKSGQFCVKLDIKMPGAEIVVTRDHDEDIYIALRDACKAARRQLVEHAERGQRGDKSLRPRSRSVTDTEAAGHE
jgi:ribosomal subunit interface protein